MLGDASSLSSTDGDTHLQREKMFSLLGIQGRNYGGDDDDCEGGGADASDDSDGNDGNGNDSNGNENDTVIPVINNSNTIK